MARCLLLSVLCVEGVWPAAAGRDSRPGGRSRPLGWRAPPPLSNAAGPPGRPGPSQPPAGPAVNSNGVGPNLFVHISAVHLILARSYILIMAAASAPASTSVAAVALAAAAGREAAGNSVSPPPKSFRPILQLHSSYPIQYADYVPPICSG